jgi:hypothetical protein
MTLEIAALIVAIIGLIPIYFLIKTKSKKRYHFDLNFGNIFFATFWDSDNPRLDGRICLAIYALSVANGSDEANTLRDIDLSYRYGGRRYQTDSYVVPSGKSPSGEPAIVVTNMVNNIVMVGWHNVRTKLGRHEPLQPGGVFSGSAVFLFEPHITDLHNIQKLSIIVNDYLGNKSTYPLEINEDWLKSFRSGFRIINDPYTLDEDGSVIFTKSPEGA